MSYQKARQFLLGLPEDQRKFYLGSYLFQGCKCVFGHLIPEIWQRPNWSNHAIAAVIQKVPGVREKMDELGLTIEESENLQMVNDQFQCEHEQNSEEDMKARFKYILDWMEIQDKAAKRDDEGNGSFNGSNEGKV
jgi:hypothetical protein